LCGKIVLFVAIIVIGIYFKIFNKKKWVLYLIKKEALIASFSVASESPYFWVNQN
jgi:hypothetical protein